MNGLDWIKRKVNTIQICLHTWILIKIDCKALQLFRKVVQKVFSDYIASNSQTQLNLTHLKLFFVEARTQINRIMLNK